MTRGTVYASASKLGAESLKFDEERIVMKTDESPRKLKLKKVTLRDLDEAARQYAVPGASGPAGGDTCPAGCSVTLCGGSHNECCC